MTSPAQLAAFLIDLAKDEEVQAEQARRLPYIPGNTVAAMVCMEEYVRPALRKMMGHAKLFRPEVAATFEGAFRKSAPDGKVHLIRVRARREGGRVVVSPSGPQGSGILSSMLRSNALALVPADALALRTGDEVAVHLIEEPEDR